MHSRRIVGNAAKEAAGPILAGLIDYEEKTAGDSGWETFTFALEDDTGVVVGGLHGECLFGWTFVRYLYVPETLRGTGAGSRLMAEAEAFARERGTIGVWLDTFAFQARGFYEKLGYRLFGELEGEGGAVTRYFMKKRIG